MIHDTLEDQCKRVQYMVQETLKQWATAHSLKSLDGTHWYHRTALVVVEDNSLRRGVVLLQLWLMSAKASSGAGYKYS
jgi:hypothetical protein